MKKPRQISREWIAALLCTAIWFGLYILCFKPAQTETQASINPAAFIRLPEESSNIYHLLDPSRFALPGQKGFSGTFPPENVDIHLKLDPPETPAVSRSRKTLETPDIEKELLPGNTDIAPSPLPLPNQNRTITLLPTIDKTTLLFSPKLKKRAGNNVQLNMDCPTELPETVRVHLRIRPDGIVQHALFETPVTNTALINAVRKFSFTPATEETEGTLEIRFPQKGAR